MTTQSGSQPGPSAPVSPKAMSAKRSFGVMDVLWFIPRMLLRLFFPKLLDRYVIGELLVPFGFGWTLFIVLFVFSVNLFKLAQLAARGAPLPEVGEMLWLRIILSSVYCLPMAVLLAGLLAFGRLSGDSELVAIQAGGIPNIRVIRNAFILGLAMSFIGLAINEKVIPPAGRRLHELEDLIKIQLKGRVMEDLTDDKAAVLQDFEGGKLARVVIAKKLVPEDPPHPAKLQDVTYMQYDRGAVQMIVQASSAEWVGHKQGRPNEQQWRFYNATTQMMARVTGKKRWVMQDPSLLLTLNKSPSQVQSEQKDADQMSYIELRDYIRQLKKEGAGSLQGGKVERQHRIVRELQVELERKLSVPFASLVLALVGAPLGIRRQRSSTGVGVGLSLLIIIGYYIGMSFLGVMGQNGVLEPREAAWGCNAVGLLVGTFLTWRSSR